MERETWPPQIQQSVDHGYNLVVNEYLLGPPAYTQLCCLFNKLNYHTVDQLNTGQNGHCYTSIVDNAELLQRSSNILQKFCRLTRLYFIYETLGLVLSMLCTSTMILVF